MALPRNAEVAEQFDLLADLLDLEGAESFRVLAYRRAATRIRETPGAVAQLALDGEAKKLDGIGKTIEEKIVQIVERGEIEALSRKKGEVPEGVLQFMRLPGLGPKTARRIWQELGVTTLDELREAAQQERLRGLSGLGAKTEEKLLKALAEPAAGEGPKRTLLGQSLPQLLAVVSTLREHPLVDRVSEAGSARRRKETVRDLDIIATASDPRALVEHFVALPWVSEVAAKGPTKATVVSYEGLRFDLRVVPPDCYGNLLQHFTGSKEHNVKLREDAQRRGLSVSEYGVKVEETGEVQTFATEEELYAFLGYAYIPPELREGGEELRAARTAFEDTAELPRLVERGDLQGDLHTHSTWSADGKNSIVEMVEKAIALGYSYYAVTDHSHYLREERLEEQTEEIAAINDVVKPFRVLHGIEVNIRANAELDVEDDVLARLDWVVASVHAARETNPTERVLAAMENPHVDCIGHLTGRKINKRGPSGVDLETVFAKAVETGTFVEINSQPDRLDLKDVHARQAAEAGVRLVINSDGHQVAALDYAELGIGMARRARLTKDQIVNTRSWREVEKLMKKG